MLPSSCQGEAVRRLPIEARQVARRRLRMLNNAQSLADLRMPPCVRHGLRVLYISSVHIGGASMNDVNVTELRQNLPAYLAKVRRGQRIKVTSRGQVIAEIVPPAPDKGEADAARARLRGSVLKYDRPLEPVFDSDEWEMNR
jgi:prevent-host-death family protein